MTRRSSIFSIFSLGVLLALVVQACGDDQQGAGAGTGEPAGQNNTNDGGSDETPGSATDNGCPKAVHFVLGAKWWWRASASYTAQTGIAYEANSEVVAVDEGANSTEVTVRNASTSTNANFTSDFSSTAHYRCDADGAHLLSITSSTNTRTAQSTTAATSSSTYNPPLLMVAADLSPGTSWTSTSTVETVTVTNGTSYPSSTVQTRTATVQETATVTVPAGTFEATKLLLNWDSSTSTAYYADGVGMIRDDTSELVAVE